MKLAVILDIDILVKTRDSYHVFISKCFISLYFRG